LFTLLIALQIIRSPNAHADSMQGKSGVSISTIRNGYGSQYSSPSCLWVLDDTNEMLFIYYIENVGDKRLQRRYSESLPNLFRQARNN